MSSSTSPDTESTDTSSTWSVSDDGPIQGPGRYDAVRVMLPDNTDETNRLESLMSLKGVFDHALKQETAVDILELLAWPGENQYEHLLCGHDTSGSDTEAIEDIAETTDEAQRTFNSFDKESNPDEDTSKNATGAITTGLEDHCASVDYQTVDIDLSPLADVPVITSRLLVRENHSLPAVDGSSSLGVIDLLIELINKNIPHVYQLLATRAPENQDYDYKITVRLAVFDEEYGIVTDEELEDHITNSYQYCIDKYFDTAMVTSNFDLPVKKLEKAVENTSERRFTINGIPEYLFGEEPTIRDLATFREYNYLLKHSMSAASEYQAHFNRYARIPMQGNAFSHVGMIIPAYFTHSPWQWTAVADAPTTHIKSTADSADRQQRYGTTSPADATESSNHQESNEHIALINFIVKFLIQQGYTILAVDLDAIDVDLNDPDPTENTFLPGGSQPDIVAKKNGTIRFFEAEAQTSNPAAFLKNLARAAHYGHEVIVVTKNESHASSKLAIASLPFRSDDTSDHGARLYNFKEDKVGQSVTYLLPDADGTAKWYLTPEGVLKLVYDGRVVAKGNAEAPLHTFSYTLPRYEKQGSEYIVTDHTGEHLGTYATLNALRNDFTEINHPFIPTKIHYCENLEIRYKDTKRNQLKRYYEIPDWTRLYRNKSGKRAMKTAEHFVETFTTEASGKSLYIPDVRAKCWPWYNQQTKLEEGSPNWFTKGLTSTFDVTDTDTRDREIKNRYWHYTPGLNPDYLEFADN